MKSLFIVTVMSFLPLTQDPTAYFREHMVEIAQKYKLHLGPEDKDHPTHIKSMKEADSILAKAEHYAATMPDSMSGVLTSGPLRHIDSFYKNPYKLKYLNDNHLWTPRKHFFNAKLRLWAVFDLYVSTGLTYTFLRSGVK